MPTRSSARCANPAFAACSRTAIRQAPAPTLCRERSRWTWPTCSGSCSQYFGGKQRNADGMLSLGAAIRSMNFTNNPTTGAEADWKAARDLGLVITVHASARGSGAVLGGARASGTRCAAHQQQRPHRRRARDPGQAPCPGRDGALQQHALDAQPAAGELAAQRRHRHRHLLRHVPPLPATTTSSPSCAFSSTARSCAPIARSR